MHLLAALPNALIFEADVAEINPFRTELAMSVGSAEVSIVPFPSRRL